MPYLTYIYVSETQNIQWGLSLIDNMLYEENKMSDRHKKRMITWAYKKKLFTSNKMENGIRLTEKGKKYVRARVTEEDVLRAAQLMSLARTKMRELA
jgi:hypothetical protein